MAIFLIIIMLVLIFTKVAYIFAIASIVIIIVLIVILILMTIKKLKFIKTSHLTYGKVIEFRKIEDTQACREFVVEYVDENTNEVCHVIIFDQFGDIEEEFKEAIQEYYQEGRKLVGKKVPVLYKTNESQRTIVFLERAE